MGRCVIVMSLMMLMMSSRFTEGIWLNLPSTGTKCVSEEILNNVVVVADYVIIDEQGHASPTVSAKVTSPYGNNLYHKENVTHGQFAFTTTEIGNYVACFWVDGNHQPATLNLDWKIGIAAKDWDSGVELEFRKLESAVESIHQNLLYLKNREAEMREVSEKTNARVAWLSIMSLSVGIVASLIQVWHLKRYFQKKKLI
uniref:GOLD domain-containing protein n=1 Tax=Chenopodium quinoa TaxID=63459 RepID=A0A803M5C3_CHEQI